MFPIIYKIGPFTIYSYGLMLALAVIICTYLLGKESSKHGIKEELIYDLVFWAVLSGIIGARLFYVILNFEYFVNNPFEIIMIQRGGLAWQGSLILGGLFGWIFLKKNKLPVLKMLDLCAPFAALGQSIGRIGCFLNGCCHGKVFANGIYFPVHGARLHPTQLYDSIGLFIIFLILKFFSKKSTKQGQIFVLYLMSASALRFTVQFFRADEDGFFMGLSIYQHISIFIFILALILQTWLSIKNKNANTYFESK